MALLNSATQVYAQLPKFLDTIRAGTAPTSFTRQHLQDIGFKSSNHHTFIPLLKGLGFLTADGAPTERYRRFLDGSQWAKVLAEAVREAYGDIFVIKAKPTNADLLAIQGKFKSTYNLSDIQAERAARTFLSLLSLCDEATLYGDDAKPTKPVISEKSIENKENSSTNSTPEKRDAEPIRNKVPLGLQYNIQIHLPATKDIEVYNAIFKSLREHVID